MLLDVIQIALALSALYGFGMWIYTFLLVRLRKGALPEGTRIEIAQFTFRLGLCAILATGFLGLILVLQGA